MNRCSAILQRVRYIRLCDGCVINWAGIASLSLTVGVTSGAGFGKMPNFDPRFVIVAVLSIFGAAVSIFELSPPAAGGKSSYSCGMKLFGCMCFAKSTGGCDVPMTLSSLTRFAGRTVVWIKLRNRPIAGFMSSGLMMISSSLNVTERRFFFLLALWNERKKWKLLERVFRPIRLTFFKLLSSVIPNIDIRRLWAVLYSVRFWQKNTKSAKKKMSRNERFESQLTSSSIWVSGIKNEPSLMSVGMSSIMLLEDREPATGLSLRV